MIIAGVSSGLHYSFPLVMNSVPGPSAAQHFKLDTDSAPYSVISQHHANLVDRFARDTEICHIVTELLNHLDTRHIEEQLMCQRAGEQYSHAVVEHFQRLSIDLFSQLAVLGVHLFHIPEGRQSYSDCSPEDLVGMYKQLAVYRPQFELGTFPLAGVDPLSTRLRPDDGLKNQRHFRSIIEAELPHYSVVNQTYAASSRPFRSRLGRFLPDKQEKYHPNQKDAQQFLYYLEREILPNLRRAVANYTAILHANLLKPLASGDCSAHTMNLLEHMYYIHDRAVTILGSLGFLAIQGNDELASKSPNIQLTMDDIHTQLIQFGFLEVEWAQRQSNYAHDHYEN